MQRIVVLGAGFAGLWSAIGAARARDEFGADQIEVVVIDRTGFHAIRVRNYEASLDGARVPLADVLDPIGVRRIKADITGVDPDARLVSYADESGPAVLSYDRLVFALGSRIAPPPIPGLDQWAFNVDAFEAAAKLNRHIAALPNRDPAPGRFTALIIGGGLTGIEAACEMPGRLRAASAGAPTRVIIADHQAWIGSGMGDAARPVIAEALQSLGVESRAGVSVASINRDGAALDTGETIAASTIVWCAGMRAHPLTAQIPVERDRLGRLPVDPCLRVTGVDAVFAAGDAAWFLIDGAHSTVMSCQHSRPMGRFAGHNVVCDLLGKPLLPLRIDWYATILDLGPWGALCTEGWDRRVASRGAEAKRTKQTINQQRIYPPRSRDRAEILAAAAPRGAGAAAPLTYCARLPNETR